MTQSTHSPVATRSGIRGGVLALLCCLYLGAAPPPAAIVTLQLKWHHQFQFAGYYAAQDQGYYRDAGLEVRILEAKPAIDVIQEVVQGRAQYGVGSSALVLSRQKGEPVVVLATVFQHSPFIIMAKADDRINSVQDLVGRRLMLERHADELIAYLRKEGVSERKVTLLPHTFDPLDLLRGKVDAMSAYVTDEPYLLKQNHQEVIEFSPRMGGIDFYGDNLFTSEAELRANPARVKAFREASMKGWKYAMQHQEEIIQLIMARYGPGCGHDYLAFEAQKMVPLLQPVLVEMGYMYPGRWQHIVDTYVDLGLLPKGFKLEGFLYDPDAGARQDYRRLTRALAALLTLGVLLGGAAVVFFRLNLKLKREIASREAAEEAIRLEHAKTERYLRVAEVILVVLEGDGRITMLNRKGHAVLGYEEGELVGRNWFDTCLPPDACATVKEDYQRILAGPSGTVRVNENVVVRKDGELRLIAWHDSPLTDAQGRVTGMLSSGEDITLRRREEADKAALEIQLQQAQRMESIGSLAGGVAHDMNNVLGAILGMASAHVEGQPEASPARQAFGTIIRAAERGGKMVKGLLTFARMSTSQDQEVDLNAVLQDVILLLERTTLAKVRLETDLAADLRPIRGDAGALNHAFMNICINAVDAMPEPGTLTIRTRNLGSGHAPDQAEVQVRDTGQGMTRDVLAQALNPFFTTKPQGKGTGLGLSMVYSTVQAHGGTLELQSEPGQGTVVTTRFPACSPAAPLAAPVTEVARLAPRALRVLLVDDDDLVRSSMEAVLEELGHDPILAGSGEEGLRRLQDDLQVDLVIMDMNMPGLGGSGTLPLLRALRPVLPVLLATGRVDQTALDLVASHAPVAILAKPFSLRELQQHIQGLLEQAHGARERQRP